MHNIEWAPRTKKDFSRLKDFLTPKTTQAANKIRPVVLEGVQTLAANPQLGTELEDDQLQRRVWRIPFGKGQYILYYSIAEDSNTIRILRIWHSREYRE